MGTTQSVETREEKEEENLEHVDISNTRKRKREEDEEVVEISREEAERLCGNKVKKGRKHAFHVKDESKNNDSQVHIDAKPRAEPLKSKEELLQVVSEYLRLRVPQAETFLVALPPKQRQAFLRRELNICSDDMQAIHDFNLTHECSEQQKARGAAVAMLSSRQEWQKDLFKILGIPFHEEAFVVLENFRSRLLSCTFNDQDLEMRTSLPVSVLQCVSNLSAFEFNFSASAVLEGGSQEGDPASAKYMVVLNTLESLVVHLREIHQCHSSLENRVVTVSQELEALGKDYKIQQHEARINHDEASQRAEELLAEKRAIDSSFADQILNEGRRSEFGSLASTIGSILDFVQSSNKSTTAALAARLSASADITYISATVERYAADVDLMGLLLVLIDLCCTIIGLYSARKVQALEKKEKETTNFLLDYCDKFGLALANYIVSQGDRLNEVKSDLEKESENYSRHLRVYGKDGAPQHRENINLMISELHEITNGIHDSVLKAAQTTEKFLASCRDILPPEARARLLYHCDATLESDHLPPQWVTAMEQFSKHNLTNVAALQSDSAVKSCILM